MRKLFTLTLFALTMASPLAFSQSVPEAGNSLKQNMKQAGTLFKAIGVTINDPAKNVENAQAAAEIAEIFKAALQQVPAHLNDIPVDQRAEALKGYQELIQKAIDHALALQQAFMSNENATANQIYKEMKEIKQDGHDQFDP